MIAIVRNTIACGLRGRSLQAVLVFGLALVAVAYLSSLFSPRHPKTVALDVGLSGIRFSLVLFALFSIQDLIFREIDRRSVLITAAYPISRGTWLLGRFVGVLALTGVAALLLAFGLLVAVLAAGGSYEQQFPPQLGLPYWSAVLAMLLDVAVVASFALWVTALSTVSFMPLATGAMFAIAARGLGPAIEYAAKSSYNPLDPATQVAPILDWIRWCFPDLSRLDWRTWAMYGQPLPDGWMVSSLGIGLASLALFLFFATWAFRRRELG